MTTSLPVLLSDELITRIPVVESGETLVDLRERGIACARTGPTPGSAHRRVRAGLGERLAIADGFLPAGTRLFVAEGLRPSRVQQEIYEGYRAELELLHPGIAPDDVHVLASRFVSPIEVAPHVAGGAVDVTLIDAEGKALDLGTEIDATPEQSDGACFFAATNISREARQNRSLLADVLTAAGLVNYPTEWWHWSYGDRYWAYSTRHPHALYGPA